MVRNLFTFFFSSYIYYFYYCEPFQFQAPSLLSFIFYPYRGALSLSLRSFACGGYLARAYANRVLAAVVGGAAGGSGGCFVFGVVVSGPLVFTDDDPHIISAGRGERLDRPGRSARSASPPLCCRAAWPPDAHLRNVKCNS